MWIYEYLLVCVENSGIFYTQKVRVAEHPSYTLTKYITPVIHSIPTKFKLIVPVGHFLQLYKASGAATSFIQLSVNTSSYCMVQNKKIRK